MKIGDLELSSNLLLAPLAGWTSLAFREVVRPLGGVGLATTEVVSACALMAGHKRTQRFLQSSSEDRPLAIQVNARTPEEAAGAARIVEQSGHAVVDFNLGCPVRKINRKGGGAALACSVGDVARVVGAAVRAVGIPVTAKIRLGWDETDQGGPEVARALASVGVMAITVHGRTRAQAFRGRVNPAGIRRVVEAVDVPVVANGDVFEPGDALELLKNTGARGVMIGRGAVTNPWIFRETLSLIRTGAMPTPPSLEERLEFVVDHYSRLVAFEGERRGGFMFRKLLRAYFLSAGVPEGLVREAVQLHGREHLDDLLSRVRGAERAPVVDKRHIVPVPGRPTDHW